MRLDFSVYVPLSSLWSRRLDTISEERCCIWPRE
jgi:hypothetical protein